MNRFEGGPSAIESGPEQKKETDPIILAEEKNFQQSAERITQDLDKILSELDSKELKKIIPTKTEFSSGTEGKEEGDLEKSLSLLAEELDKYLTVTEWSLEKEKLIAQYEERLKSITPGKGANYLSKGWRQYWSREALKDSDAPIEIREIAEDIDNNITVHSARTSIFGEYAKAKAEGKDFVLTQRHRKKIKRSAKKRNKKERIKAGDILKPGRENKERLEEISLLKEGLLYKLKKELKAVDERRDFSPEELKKRRRVFYDSKSESLFVLDKEGNQNNIEFGDLIGDQEWGIKYAPDKNMPEKIWRKIRKTLALREVRTELDRVIDKEYAARFGVPTGSAYFNIEELDKLSYREPHKVSGYFGERMITNFLTRIQYSNPELKMRVEKSNALEDTVLKYDFKIEVKKLLGIALESKDVSREEFIKQKKRLGIQFTVGKRNFKTKSIELGRKRLLEFANMVHRNVDDIVLVRIPELGNFVKLYKKWKLAGKPSGGPEQYLSAEEKISIFKQATKKLLNLSDKELTDLKL